jgi:hypothetical protein
VAPVRAAFLLCLVAWETGRQGMLTPAERLVGTAVAGLFGAALILLKAPCTDQQRQVVVSGRMVSWVRVAGW